ncbi:hypothetical protein LPTSP4_27540 [Leptospira ryugenii]|uniref:Uncharacterized protein n=1 Tax=Leptospira ryugenii TaxID=1917863 RepID=A0A2P2E2V0_9LEPT|nr:hypothetical protein [Leptospira ryugenii]GBF51222.1 hypothetical protein LPTSP4_27540 [Leptospira ryugenii]
MNRKMYVEGNPMLFTDKSGHNLSRGLISRFPKPLINAVDKFFKRAIPMAINRAVSRIKNNIKNLPNTLDRWKFVRSNRFYVEENRYKMGKLTAGQVQGMIIGVTLVAIGIVLLFTPFIHIGVSFIVSGTMTFTSSAVGGDFGVDEESDNGHKS